jgi:heterotetrameric sarcosine oxidase delta subunit
MSFLIYCPYCGPRDVAEFSFGGEQLSRPTNPDSLSALEWAHYVYDRKNIDGSQVEWWYHRQGCSSWFRAERDTLTNRIERTWAPQRRQA